MFTHFSTRAHLSSCCWTFRSLSVCRMNWVGSTFGTFRTLVCSNTILHKQYIRDRPEQLQQRQMKWQRKFSQEVYIVTYSICFRSCACFTRSVSLLILSRTSWHHRLGFVCFFCRLPSLSNIMVARLPPSANHLAALFKYDFHWNYNLSVLPPVNTRLPMSSIPSTPVD